MVAQPALNHSQTYHGDGNRYSTTFVLQKMEFTTDEIFKKNTLE
jgi:hypothetical protein